jgi:hypothetical protein
MQRNNQPVQMKAGVKDGHLRRQRDEMQCDNQPAKEKQTRGEAPADKKQWRIARQRQLVVRWRWRVERTRGGGGGATTGVTRQPAGKQKANGRGGVCRQELANCQEVKKQRQCNKRRHDSQPEAPADKRRRCLKNRRHLKTMRGGNCAARQQEKEVASCKYHWGRWMQSNKR